MKPNLFEFLSYFIFGMLLINAGQVIGQTGVPKPGTDQKKFKAETSKVPPAALKGEYTDQSDCVDLYVHKGCVNYTISAAGDKTADKASVVKVCSDPTSTKPVNICRQGAKSITVKYEKLDANVEVEFKSIRHETMKKEIQKQ